MDSSDGPPPGRRGLGRRCLAWCAHLYTALGLVAAAAVAAFIVHGQPDDFRRAFLLLIAATLIDATDGTFARRVRVREVLPGFDGRRLDDLIDFLTYTCLPLLLLWRANQHTPLLPEHGDVCLLLPLLASAYGFCQTDVKTADGYFLGFPSYWNLVAFYVYALQPVPPWLSLTAIVVLSLLTFVPSRYLYPSQRGRLNQLTTLLGCGWAALLAWIVWHLPDHDPPTVDGETRRLALVSLAYPAWYLGASWVITIRFWRRRRRRVSPAVGGRPAAV